MADPQAATIYTAQLAAYVEGFPLWDPSPGSQPAIEIADVGYVQYGAWVRLFNASKPIDDPSNDVGVPHGYRPLDVGKVQERTCLPAKVPILSESVAKRELEVTLSGGPGVPVQAGAGFSFKCTKEYGAVLVIGDDADRRDAVSKKKFVKYILEHYESSEAAISFNAGQAGIMEGGISISWAWKNCSSVTTRSGPSKPTAMYPGARSITANEDVDMIDARGITRPPPRNQCVFLRGYKLHDRKTWSARRLLRRKRKYDGFEYLPRKKRDDTDDSGPGPSRQPGLQLGRGSSEESRTPSNGEHRSSTTGSSSGSTPGGGSEDRNGSSPNPQDTFDSDSIDSGTSEDLHMSILLNQHKEPTFLEIILEYILEKSTVELALVHDDDLISLLQSSGSTANFGRWIYEVSPRIYTSHQVGMLEPTYRASLPDTDTVFSIGFNSTLNNESIGVVHSSTEDDITVVGDVASVLPDLASKTKVKEVPAAAFDFPRNNDHALFHNPIDSSSGGEGSVPDTMYQEHDNSMDIRPAHTRNHSYVYDQSPHENDIDDLPDHTERSSEAQEGGQGIGIQIVPPCSPTMTIQNSDRFPVSPWNEYNTDWKFPAPTPDAAPNSNSYTPSYKSFNSWGSQSVSWGGREGYDPIDIYDDYDIFMDARPQRRDAPYDPAAFDADIVGDMDDLPTSAPAPQLSFTPAYDTSSLASRHGEFLPDADLGVPRPRAASEHAWGSGLGHFDTVDLNSVLAPLQHAPQHHHQLAATNLSSPHLTLHPYDNPHLHPHAAAAGGAFPSADVFFSGGGGASVRRVKSDAAAHYPSEGGGSGLLPPPAGLGLGLKRHDRHAPLGSSVRSSPYPSPSASPAQGARALLPDVSVFEAYGAGGTGPDAGGALNTTNPPRKLVTTKATHDASSARRKNDPGFVCPVPGCGSTFTRSFNLKGHLRSHNERRAFKCKWPGCEKSYARQDHLKLHEKIHLNIRPYTCSECGKTFSRMDALNRHRGANCAAQEPQKMVDNGVPHADNDGGSGAMWGGPPDLDTGIIM